MHRKRVKENILKKENNKQKQKKNKKKREKRYQRRRKKIIFIVELNKIDQTVEPLLLASKRVKIAHSSGDAPDGRLNLADLRGLGERGREDEEDAVFEFDRIIRIPRPTAANEIPNVNI